MDYSTGDLVGAALVMALVLAGILFFTMAPMRVNLARRRRGLSPIRWRQIRRSRLTPAELREADDDAIAADNQLWRQMEYEKHLYHQEVAKSGYSWSRVHCKEHDRYCRNTGGAHPPGGLDNPTVPDDFDPDGAPLANWEAEQKAGREPA